MFAGATKAYGGCVGHRARPPVADASHYSDYPGLDAVALHGGPKGFLPSTRTYRSNEMRRPELGLGYAVSVLRQEALRGHRVEPQRQAQGSRCNEKRQPLVAEHDVQRNAISLRGACEHAL